MEKKSFLQGVWRELCDSPSEKKRNLVIHADCEEKIIDEILESTSADGVIEIYKVQIPGVRVKSLKTLRVCRELEICCV